MEDAVKIEANQDWAGSDKGKHANVLTIETKSGRIYYLSAPTKEAMLAWVDKLTSTFKYFLINNDDNDAASAMSNIGATYIFTILIHSLN